MDRIFREPENFRASTLVLPAEAQEKVRFHQTRQGDILPAAGAYLGDLGKDKVRHGVEFRHFARIERFARAAEGKRATQARRIVRRKIGAARKAMAVEKVRRDRRLAIGVPAACASAS